MEPIYTIEYVINYKIFRRYMKMIQSKIVHTPIIQLGICAGLVIAGIVAFIMKNSVIGIILVATAAIFLLVVNLISERNIKKAWESGNVFTEDKVRLSFYENRMIQKHKGREIRLKYDDVKKVYETADLFMLVSSKNEGFFILKEKCSDELTEFLRSFNQK